MKTFVIIGNNVVQDTFIKAGLYTFNATIKSHLPTHVIGFKVASGWVDVELPTNPNKFTKAHATFELKEDVSQISLCRFGASTTNPIIVQTPMWTEGNNISTPSPNPADLDETTSNVDIKLSTQILQTKEQVQITATKIVQLEDRVSDAEGSLTVQAGLISGKVSQQDFNALGQRVSDAEGSLTVQAGLISSVVSTVNSQGTQISSISQKADNISLKIDNLQVGGRNYLLDSGDFDKIYDMAPDSVPSVKGQDDGVNWIYGSYSGKYMVYTYGVPYDLTYLSENLIGKKVVISVEVKSSHAMNVGFYDYSEDISYTRITAGKWTRIHLVTYAVSSLPGLVVEEENIPLGTKLYYRNWKVETGDAPTDWSSAPEDLLGQLSGTGIDIKAGAITLYSGVKGENVGGKIIINGANFSVDEYGKLKASEAEISGKISSANSGDRITIDPAAKKMLFTGSNDLVFIDMAFDVYGSDKTSRMRINSYLNGSLLEYTDYRARGMESFHTEGSEGRFGAGRVMVRSTPSSYGFFCAETNRGESWANNKLIVTMLNLPKSPTDLPAGTLYRNNNNQIMIV